MLGIRRCVIRYLGDSYPDRLVEVTFIFDGNDLRVSKWKFEVVDPNGQPPLLLPVK